mgnify:CR=1 FL=1
MTAVLLPWLRAPIVRLAFAASVACVQGAAAQPAVPPPLTHEPAARPAVVLLLPAPTTALAQAAQALRAGFEAAHRVSGDDLPLQIIELGDGSAALAGALQVAGDSGAGVIVGTLPRSAVTDVVEGQRTALPLVALNFPESDAAAPGTMVAMALSLESEAQHICRFALAEVVGTRGADTRPRIAVLARAAGLERRVAQAYVQALRAQGEVPQLIEWSPGVPGALAAVAAQLAQPGLEAVFLALTARDAAQVRALIPRAVQTFGTSLLYVGDSQVSPEAATLAHDLEGVRFVDMPWMLQPDHAGVMAYPAPTTMLPAELLRLYALGIDAYRVASAWMKGERRFDIDGVTGRLSVDRAQSLRVERTPQMAVYRGGSVQRIDYAR